MNVPDPHHVALHKDTAAAVFAEQRLVTIFWWLLLALVWGALVWEAGHRGVDPDEFEHLHATFSVWRGEVPYRDFFEHHSPALYYLLAPLLQWLGPEWAVLTAGRFVSLSFATATLFVIATVARQVLQWRSGVAVAAVLSVTTIFHLKAVELRPDVPAMFLLSLALWFAVRPTGMKNLPWRRCLLVGVVCGVATAFTQKAVVPAAGLALGMLCSDFLRTPSPKSWLRLAGQAAAFTTGGCLVWGLIFGLFAMAGAAGSLWHSVFYQLWFWPVKSGRLEHLRPTLAADLSIWVAALCEVVICLRELRRQEMWDTGRGIVVVATLICLVSLIVVKATFPQFFLLWFPWLVLLAVRRSKIWFAQVASGKRLGLLAGAGIVLLAVEVFLVRRTLQQPRRGALEHLFENALAPLEFATVWLPLILLILLTAISSFLLLRKIRLMAFVLVAVIGMSYGLLRIQDALAWSQTAQRERVEELNRLVGVHQTVLDGFTGYGALRRHAYYYWWINEFSLGLMTPDERGTLLLSALKKNPPAAILFDRNLRQLPPDVVNWLETNYQPMQEPLWRPKSKSSEPR